MMPGSTELMIILGVTLIIFGPTKLPLLGKAIGESIKNFKKGVSDNDK
jgi:sec-independent protein translocase protein TatA